MSEEKHDITLQADIKVKFADSARAKAFFIDGDWCNSFYGFSNLNELANHIAWSTYQAGWSYNKDHIRYRFVEGFEKFIPEKNWVWVSEYKDYGKIIVEVKNDLEPV